jgi:hypothetical protein
MENSFDRAQCPIAPEGGTSIRDEGWLIARGHREGQQAPSGESPEIDMKSHFRPAPGAAMPGDIF